MKYLYSIVVIFFAQTAICQYCDLITENSSRDFDWRQQEFTFWLRGQGANSSDSVSICSPYYSLGVCPGGAQANTLFISTVNPDYLDSDGWELINYDFGTKAHPINEPYLVIYNKYESKLRVFYWINSNVRTDINEIKLQIQFIFIHGNNSPATHVSALLEHVNTPMRPIEGYTDEAIVILTPQDYQEQSNGVWLMTDIPIAYDPCTCQYPSMIQIQGIGTEVTSLFLTGEGIGQMNEVIDADGQVNTSSMFANANKFNSAVTRGNAAYKNMNEFTNTIDKLLVRRTNTKIDTEISDQLSQLGYNNDSLSISDIEQMYNQSQSTNPPSGLMSVVGKLFENKVSSIVPSWLKDIVPFANTAISLLDFFVGGGKSSPPKPKSFNHNMQFTFNGTAQTEKLLSQHILLVPGANYDNLPQGEESLSFPVYNNVLGIMNLVEMPILYKAYEEVADDIIGGGFEIENAQFNTSYKLANPLKYAFNPSSDLEVMDIRCAFIFRSCVTEIQDSTFYNNLILEEPGVLRTPYVPIGCLQDYSMFFEVSQPGFTSQCEGDIHLHVMAKLRSPNGEDASFAALYEPIIETAPYEYTNTPANPYEDVPETRIVDNISEIDGGNGRGPLRAWSEITVLNDWNTDLVSVSSPVRYPDFSEPPTTGVVTGPFTIISTPDCPDNHPVDAEYLADFCQDKNRYNPLAINSIVIDPDSLADFSVIQPENGIYVKAFPNPFVDFLYLGDMDVNTEVKSIIITDITGKILHFEDNLSWKGGLNSVYKIHPGNLGSGVYLLKIITNNGEIAINKVIKMDR